MMRHVEVLVGCGSPQKISSKLAHIFLWSQGDLRRPAILLLHLGKHYVYSRPCEVVHFAQVPSRANHRVSCFKSSDMPVV